jgi:hypothetical protein
MAEFLDQPAKLSPERRVWRGNAAMTSVHSQILSPSSHHISTSEKRVGTSRHITTGGIKASRPEKETSYHPISFRLCQIARLIPHSNPFQRKDIWHSNSPVTNVPRFHVNYQNRAFYGKLLNEIFEDVSKGDTMNKNLDDAFARKQEQKTDGQTV